MTASAIPVTWILLALIGVLALLVLIALPIHYGMAHARRERELEHAERMRALELGRPWPGDEPTAWLTPGLICLAIGVGVPIGACLIAWGAASELTVQATYAIWPSAGAVGVAGVICGTVLATRLSAPRREFAPGVDAKPMMDPDALDVVGRRG